MYLYDVRCRLDNALAINGREIQEFVIQLLIFDI